MTLFYTTEKYPKMKIIEENYEIIKNEIPEFYIDNIKIQRKVTEWGDNGIDLVKTLENNQDWLFSMHSIDVWFAYPLMYNNNHSYTNHCTTPKHFQPYHTIQTHWVNKF